MTDNPKFYNYSSKMGKAPKFKEPQKKTDHIKELEARNKELTLQLLAVHGQAADALDKLTKAVKALREIAVADFLDVSFAQSRSAIPIARAVLAELEGKE